MVTRSVGIYSGIPGYFVGNGYKGKTKELDNEVLKISKKLEKEFNTDIIIRFNSDKESGGAFIKAVDERLDYSVGICASLASSKFLALSKEEQIKSLMEDSKFENDLIIYDICLGQKISLVPKEIIWNKYFKTIKGAFNYLHKCLNKEVYHQKLKLQEK